MVAVCCYLASRCEGKHLREVWKRIEFEPLLVISFDGGQQYWSQALLIGLRID